MRWTSQTSGWVVGGEGIGMPGRQRHARVRAPALDRQGCGDGARGDPVEPGGQGGMAGRARVGMKREGLETAAVRNEGGTAIEEEDAVGGEHGGLAAQDVVAIDGPTGVVEEVGAVPLAAATDPAFAVLHALGGASKGAGLVACRRE